MNNSPNQKGERGFIKKAGIDTVIKPPQQPIVAQKRIEAASTQCYVIGGLFVSIGGVIGLTSAYYNWCIALCVIGTLIIIVGVVLHRRSVYSAEEIETLDLGLDQPPLKKRRKRIVPAKPKSRPQIMIEKDFLMLEPNKSPVLMMHLLNTGSTSAYDFNNKAFYSWHPPDFTGPTRWEHPGRETNSLPEIPVQQPITLTIYFDDILRAQEVAAIKAGKLLFFLYVDGSYADERQNRYPFRHCFTWDARMGASFIAPTQYWPLVENQN